MDRRSRKSRQAIFHAFESLLAEKGYSSITVKDILDRADVGRSTFYAHFSTKDALLSELYIDLFNHVVSTEGPEQDHNLPANGTIHQALTHILYHLREQHKRLRPLFKGPSSDVLWRSFQEEMKSFILANMSHFEIASEGVSRELRASCITLVFIETIKWWFAGGLRQEPEEVEQLFCCLMYTALL